MNEILSIKEAFLINIIGQEAQNQRKIAHSTGYSLGMTNILLKKLATKGYVKVVQLNGRTLRYILTPRGFREKLRRTHNYLQDSILRIRVFREKVGNLLERELNFVDEVSVVGEGEVFELTCDILHETDTAFKVNTVEEAVLSVASSKKHQKKILILYCGSAGMEQDCFSSLSVHFYDVISLMV